jgi:5-methylcytosine-specific restriction endonuclease McrA
MIATLDRPTLVLNRLWQPDRHTSVRAALVIAYTGAARLVDSQTYESYSFDEWLGLPIDEGERTIRAVRQLIKVPEVAVMTRHAPVRLGGWRFNRRNVFKRDRYTCQYCGAQPGSGQLSVDHVVSPVRGGFSGWTNCVLACETCVRRKGHRLPEEVGLKLRRPPAEPQWSPLATLPACRRPKSWNAFLAQGEAQLVVANEMN